MLLHTREWGAGDRTALLVHGIMSDSRTWRRVGPALADRGYRVIAVDLRGHGLSPRGAYSPRLFADDLVDTLPRQADLALGHSLGGNLVLRAAARSAPVRRLVVYEPAIVPAGQPAELVARMQSAADAGRNEEVAEDINQVLRAILLRLPARDAAAQPD